MTMGILWTGMVAAALVCGAVNGRLTAVTAADVSLPAVHPRRSRVAPSPLPDSFCVISSV